MTKTEQYLVIGVLVLIFLMLVNFIADNNFRDAQIDLNKTIGDGLDLQADWNESQNNINVLIAEVLKQLDKDVRSNMKVLDQLTGLLLRGEF